MSLLVSIVLPVYNGEKYLAQSIESVINQTYKNWELIAVNDASTDNTLSIIESYANVDDRIIIVSNKQNLKSPQSLNVGFAAAKGEYFSWTSDDNIYKPAAIEKMVAYLNANPQIGMVCANCDCIDSNGNYTKPLEVKISNLLFRNYLGACFLYRRNVSEKIGEYTPEKFLVEDYDYWLRIALDFQIGVIEDSLYSYRYHDSNLTAIKYKEAMTIDINLKIHYYLKFRHALKENPDKFNYLNFNGLKRYLSDDILTVVNLTSNKNLFKLLCRLYSKLDPRYYYHRYQIFKKIFHIYKDKNVLRACILGIKTRYKLY